MFGNESDGYLLQPKSISCQSWRIFRWRIIEKSESKAFSSNPVVNICTKYIICTNMGSKKVATEKRTIRWSPFQLKRKKHKK